MAEARFILLAASPGSTDWAEARKRYRRAVDAAWPASARLVLTGPFDDPLIRDRLLNYLEADPFESGSGYLKQAILHRLPRWPFDDSARQRLTGIVLRAVDGPGRREFRCYCLAAQHAERHSLAHGLLGRMESGDPDLVWRAYGAASGMFAEPFPRGHRRSRCGGVRANPETVRLQALLDRAEEERRQENHVRMAAMRERLRTFLAARYP